jgi:hypothetical protein
MALANYADLKTTVIKFSGRDDLSDNMDDFILLTEESIFFNEKSPLRLRAFESTVELSTVAGTKTVALPTGYLEARSATIEVGGGEFPLVLYGASALPTVSGSGFPKSFSVKGTNIEFDRVPDAVYTINFTYYAQPTALSSGSPTNTVLTNHPSIYLNGCLSILNSFTGELDRSEGYFNAMLRSIRGANRGDRDGRFSPAPQGRVRGNIP